MNGALVTFRKELLSYCVSPVSWLIGVLFYLWRGFEVTGLAFQYYIYRGDRDRFPTDTYGLASTFLMVILVPGILTMRTFAEERRTGSIETLMCAPVRDGAVVLGKWAAAVVFFALLWLPSVLVLELLQLGPLLDTDLAFGPVFAAYLGMFLLSGMLLAFGCFASSLTDNVLLAAVLTILFDFALIRGASMVSGWIGGGSNYYVRELLDKFDVMRNFSEWFARGLIDTSQIVFYLGGIAFFLFLCTISLSSRRLA
ncbi:MAG: ABC transporter permease [Planctomycetes bacterium]|jgi:ABC-2 type transport system permease protein|nr:ABC transporter permease [Planctomycetota bacterium]